MLGGDPELTSNWIAQTATSHHTGVAFQHSVVPGGQRIGWFEARLDPH